MRSISAKASILALVVVFLSPAPAGADFLQTVSDGFKKVGHGAVELFKKGKDKVVELFGGANPDKIPYLVRQLDEKQARVREKQELLLSIFGRRGGGGSKKAKAIPPAYLNERANDLVSAYEDELATFEKLRKLLDACAKKGKDFSSYEEGIRRVNKAQAELDRNQSILKENMARYWPAASSGSNSSAAGKDDENPSGLSKDQLAARFDEASNPYAAAGLGKGDTDGRVVGAAPRGAATAEGPAYEPGLGTEKPQGSGTAARNTGIDPRSPQVKAIVDEWLASKGLDDYGRLLKPGMSAAGPADTGGLSREAWLMGIYPELRQYVKARLQGSGSAALPAAPAARSPERPAAVTSTETSRGSYRSPGDGTSLAGSDRSARNSHVALKSALESGRPDPERLRSLYQDYKQKDQQKRQDIANRFQATSTGK